MKTTEEGYRACPSGRHWGAYNAAGILPWTIWRGRVRVLLGKRGQKVHAPGTWDGFGGALTKDELPFLGALRELNEEITLPPGRAGALVPAYQYFCNSCGWLYNTYLLELELADGGDGIPAATVRDHRETSDLRWVHIDQVPACGRLHPRFAEAWPELERQLRRLAP